MKNSGEKIARRRPGVAAETVVPCCRCGAEAYVAFYYSEDDKARRVKVGKALCRECYREKVSAEAAEYNRRKGYTALLGSERQIGWAESIRERSIRRVVKELGDKGYSEFAKRAEYYLGQQRAAKFWIEHIEYAAIEELIERKINEVVNYQRGGVA